MNIGGLWPFCNDDYVSIARASCLTKLAPGGLGANKLSLLHNFVVLNYRTPFSSVSKESSSSAFWAAFWAVICLS